MILATIMFRVLQFYSLLLAGLLLILSAAHTENDTLVYFLIEELPANAFVGEISSDFGASSRYSPRHLRQLHFDFATQLQDFYIANQRTGTILTTAQIDRERRCPQKERCTIFADVVLKPVELFQQVIKIQVEIIDINDNDPQFYPPEVNFSMSEMTHIGADFLVGRAYDPDTIQFGIQHYHMHPKTKFFHLNVSDRLDSGKDLKLILTEKLDYEQSVNYELRIVAIDGGYRSGSVVINFEVEDANDNSPEFIQIVSQLTIDENVVNQTIVATVRASDADSGFNGDVWYSISNGDTESRSNAFAINRQTGEIYVNEPLDFECQSTYVLCVTASDKGEDPRQTYIMLTIHVEDVNDNSPAIILDGNADNSAEQVIVEILDYGDPGSFVLHFSVKDLDTGENGKFRCFIDSRQFLLQEMLQGEYKIVTTLKLDRKNKEFYNVLITCQDYGNPNLDSTARLRINVIQSPRNIFKDNQIMHVAVTENNQIGSEIARIFINKSINRRILFELDEEASKILQIDFNSLVIITSKIQFDREVSDHMEFNITARDYQYANSSNYKQLSLSILDQDDEIPQFSSETYTFHVSENLDIGTKVGYVLATDRDSAPFNQFVYSMQPEHSSLFFFQIDIFTGLLLTKKSLDREAQSLYLITVTAVPQGQNENVSAHASVVVYVDDTNDNKPQFIFPSENNSKITVSSSLLIGDTVTKLCAYDADESGENSEIFFKVVGGNGSIIFHVDSATGQLILTKSLNDNYGLHSLELIAKDKGQPQLYDVTTFYVEVEPRQLQKGKLEGSILHSQHLMVILAVTLLLLIGVITLLSIMITRCVKSAQFADI